MPSTLAGFTEATLPVGAAAVVPTPQVVVYEGPVGSGKTARLAARVAELLAAGADPGDVLVLCATPTAAAAFADTLSAQVEGAHAPCVNASLVTVATPLGYALDVLSNPCAQEATSRCDRVLCSFEADVLLNELQPLGVEAHRLEQIISFFERSWSDLAHRDPRWLITHEERDLIGLFEAAQGATGALLPVQVVPLVDDYLAADPEALARFGRAHVLLDDALAQTRAVQVLASLLARESLAVACDPGACTTAFGAHANAAGLDELLAANPRAERVALEAPAGAPAELHTIGITVESHCVPVRELAFDDPFDEFVAVSRMVRERVDAGVAPAQICVAAAHPTWRANLALALEDAEVPVARVPQLDALAADVRSYVTGAVPCAYTLLQLAANRRDPVALRSWCGFGDHFLMATEFAAVYDLMAARNLTLADALDQLVLARSDAPATHSLRAEALRGAANVERAYEALLELLDKALAGLRGPALLQRLAELVTPDEEDGAPAAAESVQYVRGVLDDLCAPVGEDDAPADLAQRALRSVAEPQFTLGDAAGVRLCDPREAYGAAPAFVVAAGCMNGFVPALAAFQDTLFSGLQRERILAADAHVLQTLLANAGEAVVTRTTTLPAVAADALGVEIARLRLKAGERVAVVDRSACLG